ncbi:MAG: PAS domain-containing sensor histidine kinase, partial [Chitinophagaceae bacterium]
LRAIGHLKGDPSGEFSVFTGVVMEITESYLAQKKVELAEESLRMAIDAAELASYYINVSDWTYVPSIKLKEFLGFQADEVVSLDAALGQIREDYRQAVTDQVTAAINRGEKFDMEYPVIGFHDGKTRWMRGVGTIQQQGNGVDSYFTGVVHEITERKMDEIRKNDFIGMVSHELKTPLTSLTGYLQLMERNARKKEDVFVVGASGSALKQVKKMTSMINGFLNISRLESGKISLERTVFDLNELIAEAVEDISQLETGSVVEYNPCAELKVFADHDKIGSVLSNFLSNAIKYSAVGAAIKVTCDKSDQMAQVSIFDQGRGIHEADLEKIFERFYRVQGNSNVSGFGIGLYLSAEIIRRHEGHIRAESELGKGSVFHFSIPLADENS